MEVSKHRFGMSPKRVPLFRGSVIWKFMYVRTPRAEPPVPVSGPSWSVTCTGAWLWAAPSNDAIPDICECMRWRGAGFNQNPWPAAWCVALVADWRIFVAPRHPIYIHQMAHGKCLISNKWESASVGFYVQLCTGFNLQGYSHQNSLAGHWKSQLLITRTTSSRNSGFSLSLISVHCYISRSGVWFMVTDAEQTSVTDLQQTSVTDSQQTLPNDPQQTLIHSSRRWSTADVSY